MLLLLAPLEHDGLLLGWEVLCVGECRVGQHRGRRIADLLLSRRQGLVFMSVRVALLGVDCNRFSAERTWDQGLVLLRLVLFVKSELEH